MDISKIKVSVIIPCYNAAEYLSEALDSIIVQTHRNIEIICVDDGSIDNTSVLLSNYATQYNNVRVVTNECNLKLIKTLLIWRLEIILLEWMLMMLLYLIVLNINSNLF